MSAVTWESFPVVSPAVSPVASPGTSGARRPGRRGHLRLVPPAAPSAPLRLTRRARLVRTTALLTLAAGLVASVGVARAAGPTGLPQAPRAVVVHAGESLWQIASAELPGMPVADAVARIQLANGMSTGQIRAGERLLIPAP